MGLGLNAPLEASCSNDAHTQADGHTGGFHESPAVSVSPRRVFGRRRSITSATPHVAKGVRRRYVRRAVRPVGNRSRPLHTAGGSAYGSHKLDEPPQSRNHLVVRRTLHLRDSRLRQCVDVDIRHDGGPHDEHVRRGCHGGKPLDLPASVLPERLHTLAHVEQRRTIHPYGALHLELHVELHLELHVELDLDLDGKCS